MTRIRSEDDWMDGKPPVTGAAEAVASDDAHGAHVFLYVPDISERTGWSTHRVPERAPERAETRAVGFRQRGRP